ncbi:hypothetical protein QOZ80_1AG0022170 [Eleusine coracana subsp. coracana]|nr:hypothetical protein QOZ80_1AG0022170 [Eleusine coracana subsp. coracana]
MEAWRPWGNLPDNLPWLIFHDADAPAFYTAFTDSYHPCRLPAEVHAVRWRGSANDGWLILALAAPHAYVLYNLNSGGQRIDLPSRFRSDNNVESPLVLLTAALSASPSNGDDYMVAAIALVDDRPTATFWTPGHDSWFSTGSPLAVMPQDVIHYQDAFFFITPREELVKFKAAEGPNGGVVLRRENLGMRQRAGYNVDAWSIARLGRKKRYLVESRENLLMVVRDIYYREGTDLLRVFRLFVPTVINGYRRRFSWPEIFQLVEGFAGKVVSDEVKQLAEGVRDKLRDLIGVEKFVEVYNSVRKSLKEKLESRKQSAKVIAAVDPARHAKRKLRTAAKHREHKRRKIMAMKLGRWML